MITYLHAETLTDYEATAKLFLEYAQWLNIDLSFQHFDDELLQLKSMYALPYGGIILCKDADEYVGCVGIRKLNEQEGEMKRMYVKPQQQGKGIASELLKRSLDLAKQCGYTSVRLDTHNTMEPAMKLYKKFGFIETPAYYHNPNTTVVYFQKTL